MLKEPQIDSDALWKQRYRLPTTYGRQIAQLAPTRGLAVSNRSGVYQLYAWNVPTGELRPLTHRPEGVVRGTISPDGTYVYYHDDQKGNEVGHTVRVPFEGGMPEDTTPDLPLHELAGFSFSHTGNRLGFTTITPNGFNVYCVDVGPNHTLDQRRKLHHSDVLTHGPDLSYNGEVAAITTADHPGTLRDSILAFDSTTDQQIGRLSDEDGSVELHMFSPLADDMRLLGTTDKSGVKRPLLWNVRTGERVNIALSDDAQSL